MQIHLVIDSLDDLDRYRKEQLVDDLAVLSEVGFKLLVFFVLLDLGDNSPIGQRVAHLSEQVTDQKRVEVSICSLVQLSYVLDQFVSCIPALWPNV